MEKDKIILVKNSESVIVSGNNSDDCILVEINGGDLNFKLYCHISAEQLAIKKGFSIKAKPLRIVEFEDEIYLRAKSDKDALAPTCITEDGDMLNVVNLLETDCTSTIYDMQGDVNQVAQNFDIVEGRPFLMEDEFSL